MSVSGVQRDLFLSSSFLTEREFAPFTVSARAEGREGPIVEGVEAVESERAADRLTLSLLGDVAVVRSPFLFLALFFFHKRAHTSDQ